ncbi:DNA polymerase III, alpha subunit [Thiohalobacter thiocyanaticus]|uniref:DNA polymerase III, alpha subunit n=2 Tax=Thiohalobacter thiocyanaticus TaxID=585455 RepID=A0A1Z4VVK2_9GAMM|nr:DNA polymerase III, alpha subunit [Thiohalobacter thiocyanaticus]
MEQRPENRTEKRILRTMNVVLHKGGNGLLGGRIRNISGNGIYIELTPEQRMKPGDTVRLAFKTHFGLHIVPSRVVRVDDSGSAMAFTRRDERLTAALARMSREEPGSTLA